MDEILRTIVETIKSPVKYLSLVSILFPLITGLLYFARHEKWQRILFAYIFIGSITELITLVSAKGHVDVFIATQNFFTIFECGLLLLFFGVVFSEKRAEYIFRVVAILYAFWAFLSIVHGGIAVSNNYTTTIEAVLLVLACFTFVCLRGFETKAIIVWVSFLILIYFSANFITFKYEKQIDQDKELRSVIYTLHRLTNIFYNFVLGLALRQSKKNEVRN